MKGEAGIAVQVVECLPRKHKALSSKPQYLKKKKKKNTRSEIFSENKI
jgi:hypothetical protein